jgi:hypothetical protein
MECLFPRSSTTPRRFAVEVTELAPGTSRTLCGVAVQAWEADHPSGAPALLPRLDLAGKTIAYTGDTAWSGAIAEAAADADLLIAEAYYRDKHIPYHLRLADLHAHLDQLTARRVILTHVGWVPAYDRSMRHAQRGGYTPAEQQRRERLRLEVLAATLSAHDSAAFGVHVLAGAGVDLRLSCRGGVRAPQRLASAAVPGLGGELADPGGHGGVREGGRAAEHGAARACPVDHVTRLRP